MKFILARKQKMTQMFDEGGKVCPATLALAEPNEIKLLRTKEKDGYFAAQVVLNKKRKEFRLDEAGGYKIGDSLDVTVFKEGDIVEVSGISKAKGFQGVMKRHGFSGGQSTHGQKHSSREPGSIGAAGVQKVIKGTKMAGRMGGGRVTVKNLKILRVDKDNNQILISGAIPGRRGTLLEIKGNE